LFLNIEYVNFYFILKMIHKLKEKITVISWNLDSIGYYHDYFLSTLTFVWYLVFKIAVENAKIAPWEGM
jgi:hypothetical protein